LGNNECVGRCNLARPASRSAQARGVSGKFFVDLVDLAHAKQSVRRMIAAMVTGQRLYEDDGWDKGRPEIALAKLRQSGSLTRQRAQSTGVEN